MDTIESPQDNDEINVCSMLQFPLNQAGVIEVVVTDSSTCTFDIADLQPSGVYGWVKNVPYKGKKRVPSEPFTANVVGVGKTELRVTPIAVNAGQGFTSCEMASLVDPGAYAENTFE